MWFTRVSLHNPVLATMVMLALVVLGLVSYQRMQTDQFPNVDFPVVVITTAYPGASPEIVENEVSKPVEEAVNTIAGLNSVTSRSYAGTSVVIAEFGLHVESRRAAEDVREKVAQLRATLRDEINEPRVLRFDPASRPVWSVAVLPNDSRGAQPMSAGQLSSWADNVLRRHLENVRGVGAVNLVGDSPRAIQINLSANALEAYGLSVGQVLAVLRAENQDMPVGVVDNAQRERVVQIDSPITQPQDFMALVVARRGGQSVRLGQVAQVVDAPLKEESLALYNGQRTLLVEVQKGQDENTIEVVDGLNDALADLQAKLPSGVRLEPVADTSRPIRVSVKNVRQTLIEGALLTVGIVFLFLNSWRSTVITGLTLPIAAISTFLFMYAAGFTINMVTLMALSLCIGLLIDDAIVVRENIVRHARMGKSSFDAAMQGTQEIGFAVLATTLSIVAVFLPIGFMGGIIGKFFHQFGLTIVAAVVISMFVSFTLDPMLSSVWHDPAITEHGKWRPVGWYNRTIGRVTHAFDRLQNALSDWYQDALGWSLKHKLLTLLLALITFIGSLMAVPLLGSEFVPQADYSETSVRFNTPVGSSLEVTEAKAKQVEQIIRSLPEVAYTLTTINSGSAEGRMYANVYIRLVDRKARPRSVQQVSPLLRDQLRRVAGITVTHVGLLNSVGGNKQIEFSLQGPSLDTLNRLNNQVLEKLATVPGLVDVDSSVKANKPTVSLAIRTEQANDAGLSTSSLAGALRTLIAGETVGNWRGSDDQTFDVIARLASADRQDVEGLKQLPLVAGTASDGTARVVRLGQVAEVRASVGANQINRRNLTRQVSYSGNVFGRSAGEVAADVQRTMDELVLPQGYRIEFSGSTKDMKESFAYAIQALVLAVVFIYMILASQFKSFLQPLALMTSLPLTMVGVVLILMMFGSTMSMFSVIGIVMLMGLVTKNAILLVDFANRGRAGIDDQPPLAVEAALLQAARVRLRPILMTTLAMVFGMVPLAFGLSEGSEQRAPLGQAVIGGVVASSLLTLVVVPVMYCYMDNLANWLKRHAKRRAS
jgi:HAE1 family hydrophobic/amphiphilic exporter-1